MNVGKNRETPVEAAAADYREAARLAGPHADYVVLNVSSPNTPGLRDLESVQRLRPLIEAVKEQTGETPLLVKISPDLGDDEIDAVADLALELRLAGIIATNTTVSRDGLADAAGGGRQAGLARGWGSLGRSAQAALPDSAETPASACR